MLPYQKLFWFLLIVLNCICVITCASDILIPSITEEHLIAKIVSSFTLKFMQNEATFISVIKSASTPGHNLVHQDIISNFIMLNDGKFTYRFIGPKERFGGKHAFYLFLIESYEDFAKILSRFNSKGLRISRSMYYLTIVSTFYNDTEKLLDNLFFASFEKSILDINFLLPHQNQSTWLMTTYQPFVKTCNTLKQVNVALLTEKNYSLHESFSSIYPKKLKDFRQCPLIAAVFNTPPFMIIRSRIINNTTIITYDGIDTQILQQLAEKLNFKLVYRMPADEENRGTIYPNGTTTGCIKMVVDHDADFTVGAYMATTSRSRYMMPSKEYIQVTLGFAILPSEDISTPLEKLMAPFSPRLWLSTSLCITLAVIIISFTKKLTRRRRHFIIGGHLNSSPILNMWNTLLGGSIGNPRFAEKRYLGTFARSLLMIWLLGCVVIRGSYQGALYDFFQREILSSPYDTITKINESDCNLIVMSTATSSLDKFYFSKDRHLVYNYSQQTIFRQVFDRELNGVVYCNDLQMKYFNLLNTPHRVFEMTKDRLFLMSVIVYFNNDSLLRSIFDEEIAALTDSGLIGYWTREYIDERTENIRFRQRIPRRLRLKQVFGIFEICIGLCVVCTIVFALEKLSIRFIWIKNLIENVTY